MLQVDEAAGVGDVYFCGKTSGGVLKAPSEKLRARKVAQLFAKYNKAALLEDGRVFWLNAEPQSEKDDQSLKILNVKQLDIGGRHVLVLKADGQVYSCGEGEEGQLGIGARGAGVHDAASEATQAMFHVWPLEKVRVAAVSCGEAHSAALATDGDLYTWGRGYEGQLGLASKALNDHDNDRYFSISLLPKLVPAFSRTQRKARSVSCGHRFTAAVTATGEVWTWGDGTCGQLGIGRIVTKQPYPRMAIAQTESGAGFVAVSCGWGHVLALASSGELYAWGLNNYGQLGLGDCKKRMQPCHVTSLPRNLRQVHAVAGSSGALTFEGELLMWGSGGGGKLFHNNADSVATPKPVSAFAEQYVARFALTDRDAYAFAPAQVRRISLRFDPLNGGSDLQIEGVGFFDTRTIIVKFQPVGQAPARSAPGTFIVDKTTGRRYIRAKTPRFGKPGDVTVEVCLNGKDFTSNGLRYTCYNQPDITGVAPRYSHMQREGTTIMLRGNGIFKSSDVKVKFVDAADNVQVVSARVEPEPPEDGQQPISEEDMNEYNSVITCVTPTFHSDLPRPIDAKVKVAMNGHHFVTINSSTPFIFHDASINSLKPSAVPAEGGTTMLISGSSFFQGLTMRVCIYYRPRADDDDGVPLDEDGSPQVQCKSSIVPTVCESVNLIRAKAPSTRYVLGKDDLREDFYRATAEIMAGSMSLTIPFELIYYNEPTVKLSQPFAPATGGAVLTLSSTDRPILPTAAPVVTFSSADGTWSHVVEGQVVAVERSAAVSEPPAEDLRSREKDKDKEKGAAEVELVVQVTLPALPIELRPPIAAPASSPPVPAPAPSPATTMTIVPPTPAALTPVNVTVAYNGETASRQVLKLEYYNDPSIKEVSSFEGFAGDKLTIKGLNFFPSPVLRVAFYFGDGPDEVAYTEGVVEDVGGQLGVVCTVPQPPKPLPCSITAIGAAMDGATFVKQPIETGKNGLIKYTVFDPAKPKKKK